jgi:DHA1 family bicyclomycin/chloramphenicol resistance-like MFS transporter
MAIGAATSALVSFLSNHTALPMTGVMAACALTSFIIVTAGSRMILKLATIEQAEEESAEMIITS